ncbi:4-hydroxybenzoate octaprenyltransferase [Parahalioglobus pacificus]|uniref:4-hydroxybenzoate octaprenyltransferase n=1 Tax=Parahalioglobus pacificus TaxID=930806 RepID=A0A918XJE5_9GAMM|nr:4-hydroxybenzoate octaprenyltransferase [Halioglobus pacificus]GHD34970.1 4-hydroxybenzoate octaprenyltransferase [Halioglobus pacificus]
MLTADKTRALLALIRFDKPIGTLLLLWPTLWALWIAAEGVPPLHTLLVFVAGTFLMRSAGCVINDLADRNLDGGVARTSNRPLVTGAVSVKEAVAFFLLLLLAAFALVLTTNTFTVMLSVVGALLASIYPLMKRVTHLPQLVLGLAFSWGIPMAFAAVTNDLPPALWLLVIANFLWTVVYDTKYAMVDRDDDIQIGIKSTAILFGRYDLVIIAALQVICLAAWWLAGREFGLGQVYQLSLVVAAGLFGYHLYLIRGRDREACFRAFRHNNWVGLVIFAGIALSYLG